jgi:hypothetical protein
VRDWLLYGILAVVGALGLMLAARPTSPLEAAKPSPSSLEATAAPATARSTTAPTSSPSTAPTSAPSTSPSTAPATQTAAGAVAPAKAFPPEFSVLLSRSLFARGAPGAAKNPGEAMPGGPEANLGLRGVLLLDGVFTALVEDLASKRAQQLKAGDSVGPGKIKAITLDAIEYVSGATTRQVSIGQNLLGMPLPASAPPQPAATQPAAQPGQPGAPGQPGGQPGQPGGPQPSPSRIRRGR